ncbi:hypothetical protein IGI37_003664 [Enterococcus sp. AZ194]|uniref:Cna B-type domain-containing protein n=1 Tax=Enterococcus sp. AZ194 TaxID=2774629 RepID=UPI003F29B199
MDRLRKVLTVIGLIGILANIFPVTAFAVTNNENGIQFNDVKLVTNEGNEITETNTVKKDEEINLQIDWALVTANKVSQNVTITKQLPTNLVIPDQSGTLTGEVGTYTVKNNQLNFMLSGYTEETTEATDEVLGEKVPQIKDYSGTITFTARTINAENVTEEIVQFEDQVTRTLFYEKQMAHSGTLATSETETKETSEKGKEATKQGIAPFSTDLSSTVSIDGLRVYKRPIGQDTWTLVPEGGSIMMGDAVKFEVEWSIPNLTAQAGDTLKIPLSPSNFGWKNTNPQDLITEGIVIGTWHIQDNHFVVVFNDKIESKDLLKNGTVEAIGGANKVGDNSSIVINNSDIMHVDIVPAPVVEIPDKPWPVGSDAMKTGNVSGGNLNQMGWSADLNFQSMREYYETGNFPVKNNFLFIDELSEGTKFAEGSLSLTSSIKAMFDNQDGTFTMGQIQVGTGVPITHPGFSKLEQNPGESKADFKTRVAGSPQLTYGVYKDTNSIETVIVNFGSIPSASSQIKYKKDVAMTGIDKLYNEGKLTVAGRQRLLDFLEDIDYQAPAFRLLFRVDVTGGTNLYKNKASIEWDSGSTTSNEAGVKYEDVNAGVQTGEKGSIRVLKKDDLGEVLSGIEFKLQVKDGSGNFVDYTPIDGGEAIRTTDASGLLEYKKLDPGTYRLVELVDFTDPESEYYGATIKITKPDGSTTTTDEFEIKASDSKGFVANVVNTRQLQKKVTKVWNDGNNQDGLRPTSVQVQLYADGVAKGSPITLNEGNNWSHIWKELPAANQGTAIQYTIQEVGTVTGYTTVVDDTDPTDVTVTNSHAPEKIEVSGSKTWEDANNQDGLRPASITVNLLADGVKVDSKTVTAADNWAYTFTNLDKFISGQEIVYTISEEAVTDYTTTYDGFDITNSYTPGETGLTVTKAWDDANNQDGLRPTNIQVQLYADGVAKGTAITLNQGNNWTYTWTGLPEKSSGQTIAYTVQEVGSVTGYTRTIDDSDPGNVVITNSHTPEEIEVSGTKTWDDANNQDGLRPASITVNLFADGIKIDSKVVSSADSWAYAFSNLPKFANGQAIIYTISEEAVTDYTTTYNGFDITNSYTPGQTGLTVTKAWDDANNQDGLRPTSIQVQLYADGVAKGTPVTLNTGNNWSQTWTGLDEKKAGQTIVYTVKEIGTVTGYTTVTDETDPANIVITNTHKPEEVDVKGSKTWDDANNQDGIRPANIIVNLYADGVKIDSQVVTAADSWEYTFTNLPKFANGQEIVYTISEDSVADYTTTYNGFDITNSYTPSETGVTVTKVWDDADDQDGIRPGSIQVQLYADGLGNGVPITLNAGNNWSYTWTGLPEKSAGQTIAYTVQEVGSVTGYITSMDDTDSENVIITNIHKPEEIDIAGSKTWDDANNQDGLRPTSITVNLLADGVKIDSRVVTVADSWDYAFNNLPKYANGQEIVYTITEDEVTDYTTTYNGFNVTNSYTPGKTSISVRKSWDDANNQDGLRPASIDVQLYADGVANGTPVTLNAGNNWGHTWTDLDEKKAGQTIAYTVQEVGSVTGYTTAVDESDPANVLITNSHTPEQTEVKGTKTWDDANNQDGIRPTSIVVNLYADGVKIASQVVTAADNWAYTFTNLDKYALGQEIVYTITEDAVTNYTTTYNSFDITNSYTPGKTGVTVTKVWADANNQDGLRPTSIQAQLYADGVSQGAPVTLNAGNNWGYTWTDLDEKQSGQTIVYTVQEVGTVNGYMTVVDANNPGNVVITNTHTPEEMEITGSKTWNDANDQDGLRPTSITVNLLADGTKIDSQVITAAEGWAYQFVHLPKFVNGQEIVYTITEETVPNYTTTYNGFDITNSYTPGQTGISVTKTWNDANNQDGLRPASIEVQLYADGLVKGAPVTLTEGNNWSYTWTGLDERSSGQTIAYTVQEVGSVSEYTTVADDSDPANVVITNSHIPEQTEVNGTKTWNDANNQDGLRPASITVNLLADGVKVASQVVTATDNWTYTFTNLDKFANGQEIVYTISEEAVTNYTTTYNDFDITNSYTPGKTGISVTKVWDDANNQDGLRPTSIDVQLYADGLAQGAPVTLNTGNNWGHTWTDLDEKKAGQTIVYTVQEVGTITDYTTTVDDSDPANVIITNSHTPEELDITGSKTWDDANDQDGVRPTSITVNLWADGTKIDSQIITATDSWDYAFNNLPKFANGQEIVYAITEEAVTDYTTTYNGFDITNSYTPGKTGISVTKVWEDGNNQDGLRPTSIQVQLYADGVAKEAPVTLNTGNNWSHTWTGLDEKKAGQTIVYTVQEVGTVTDYITTVDDSDPDNIVITNTHVPEKTEVLGSKQWNDANDQDGLRPTSITVNLLADGVKVDSRVVTAADNWDYAFTNLDKYANGQEIVYTITEEMVTNYTTTYNGFDITNNYTPGQTSISVLKVWEDANDQDGLRPTSIQVQLYADGLAKGTPVTLSTGNGWSHTWTGLDEKKAGQTIVYTVQEVGSVTGYTTAVEASDPANVVITNSHIPEQIKVSGIKTWEDANDQDGLRPENIIVNLLADGVKVDSKVVTAADNWEYTFNNLPKFANGQEIVYTISEEAVADYTTTYNGFDITNSYTPGKTGISVTKVWEDGNNQDGLRPTSIQVQLYADGAEQGAPVTLNAGNNWRHTWTDLDEKKAGQTIIYTVQEVGTITGYTTTVDDSDPANVVITNNHLPEKVDIAGSKTWEDANNQDGLRPTSITVNLLADGVKVDSKVVTATDSWDYAFNNLPKFANGQEIVYTISEEAVAGYTTTYNGFDITNSYTPGKTGISVTKVWADANNQEGLRPTSIAVQLYADGAEQGAPVILNTGNNWRHTWTGLDEKQAGQTIVYTVQEVGSVTGYTTVVNDSDPANVVITNNHLPEKVDIAGSKTWEDANNQDGLRPTSITVNLLADGVKVDSKVVTATDSWDYAFNNLPKFANGQEIVYTISEEAVADYTTTYNGFDITNSYTPGKTGISVTKVWEDGNNQDGLRPASIQVQLYADGAEQGAPVTLNAGNNWRHTWTGLDEKQAGQTIVYTVQEVGSVTGYTTVVNDSDPANVVITNNHLPEKVDIAGSKTWEDANNQDGLRPTSITVNLLADGVKVDSKVVTATDSWDYAFNNLPKFANGQEIVYTISEEAVAGYTTTYNGFDITNSYTPGKTGISVTKVWADANNQEGLRPTSIAVQLYADGAEQGAPVILNTGNNWRHTWTDLAERINGELVHYTVKEIDVAAGYTATVDASDPVNVVITNHHTPKVDEEFIQIIGQKTWADDENKAGARPAEITVNLLADGVNVASRKVTEKTKWTYSFDNLKKVDGDGRKIVYTISEETVENYTPTYNGFDITNTYTPETTSVKVTKVWDDNNDQDKLRAKSIEVQLLANNQPIGEVVTLSKETNWQAMWTDLPKETDGKAITYSVKEISEVKGYESSVTNEDATNITVTNKHVPKTPEEPKAEEPETPKTEKKTKAPKRAKELPRTGAKESYLLSYLGASLLALVVLLKKRVSKKG